ncbi:SRPBCC family protein [Paenibacillus periandrae]|uniref:SRPBCC family protein n=1 Tax=Paenibacillus periandrae TaxID=1761741 RepID=UPI001F0938C6
MVLSNEAALEQSSRYAGCCFKRREYDYPVELVWKAWTDPTLVMKWWGPAHYTSPRCVIGFREGSKYVFGMRAPETHGGTESYSAGVYKKIVPMQRLGFK